MDKPNIESFSAEMPSKRQWHVLWCGGSQINLACLRPGKILQEWLQWKKNLDQLKLDYWSRDIRLPNIFRKSCNYSNLFCLYETVSYASWNWILEIYWRNCFRSSKKIFFFWKTYKLLQSLVTNIKRIKFSILHIL